MSEQIEKTESLVLNASEYLQLVAQSTTYSDLDSINALAASNDTITEDDLKTIAKASSQRKNQLMDLTAERLNKIEKALEDSQVFRTELNEKIDKVIEISSGKPPVPKVPKFQNKSQVHEYLASKKLEPLTDQYRQEFRAICAESKIDI